ncbi:PEP-CTERM sorting domain-containing protein [Marinobacter lipolyticus]|mgnify:CR=1 FL=1|uniref:PEP-CTERM sorting domain-containing protein n=1 Tax=Marinobacter lipolyticus TaxID=209639 RepID=UPI001BCEC951|nr:PEP-CTERM sorting domain-containing protein [Marinobacter lipolyticus]MBS8242023.1 PEP-CTERM sorting domain-containing protein [Marinobacter lipolyticus]
MSLMYRWLGSSVVGILASVVLSISPATTEAGIITIEAFEYSEGTDLSNISPHVTLQRLYGTGSSGPITAQRSGFSGDLVFGTYELGWNTCVGRYECAMGFGMAFSEAPQWVSLSMRLHNIAVYEYGVSWLAFDSAGDLITFGRADTDGYKPGQFFAWNIQVPNMSSLVVGGGDYPSPGDFDRLSFAVGVPEPAPFAMLAVGLGGIALLRRRKLPRAERIGSAG